MTFGKTAKCLLALAAFAALMLVFPAICIDAPADASEAAAPPSTSPSTSADPSPSPATYVFEAAGATLEVDATWNIQETLVGDIDGDGSDEVVLLVEKPGSYGKSAPFWITRGEGVDAGLSQHVFIYRIENGSLRPKWMSSALGVQIERAWLTPTADPAASSSDPAASSSDPAVSLSEPAAGAAPACMLHLLSASGGHSTWVWDSWGLTLVDEVRTRSTATILVAGDNIAHANVYSAAWDLDTLEFDFVPIYAHIADLVSSYDLAVVCQETPLVSNPAMRSSFPQFATPQSIGDALAKTGFDVVLAATNHVNDVGEIGLADTLAFWQEEHPEVTLLGLHESSHQIDIVEVNGISLALFDYTYGLNGRDIPEGSPYSVDLLDSLDTLLIEVNEAENMADLTICFLHIGEEYDPRPTAEQAAVIERLVDAGADAVVCSHTHVVGPYQAVCTSAGNRGVVFYGLGNFMSGQQSDPATILGGLASLEVRRSLDPQTGAVTTEIVDFGLIPTVCHYDADGTTAVYQLAEYTPQLAASHRLNAGAAQTAGADGHDAGFTVDDLRDLWDAALATPTSPRTD